MPDKSRPMPPPKAAIPGVQHHGYELLVRVDGEPSGYGMYTYVILGAPVGKDAPTLPEEVGQRYANLLKAISQVPSINALIAADIAKETTNLFAIPALKPAGWPSLANYNSALAATYKLIALKGVASETSYKERIETGPGPFLISTLKPLNQIRTPGPMLFANLSRHNPAAMAEVAVAYMDRLEAGLANQAEAFEPLRLKLLTLILDADDNIKLMKDAVADWLPGS